MVICLDFDGTCTTHDYPRIGLDIGAMPVLRELRRKGHQIVLFTMRSGKELTEAVRFLEASGIDLYGVNENPTQKEWTQSPKAYGQLYIDDAALGCPLLMDPLLSTRPFVNWRAIKEMLIDRGIL